MEFSWSDTLHRVNYGLVQGMSTRKGTVVLLDQIIEEAVKVMHDQMQKNEEKYNTVEDLEDCQPRNWDRWHQNPGHGCQEVSFEPT